ncbi:uncharacterized protein LOC120287026 [Eucalyptus grandis]|uniref:uncharacterized protein LOC120287026 n=1 Tax=Eucalyptus grandis TaxID=71139 RepID=UPI00192EE9EC|nr:uncharacterized protein LOC120287026 [Eucalyptus grandis]
MAPFEASYGRVYRTPVCWDEVGERKIIGPELVQQSMDATAISRDGLKTAQSRQKSYADKHWRPLEFQVGDHIFLKGVTNEGYFALRQEGKMSSRYVGPFEILERIGTLPYRLALPPRLAQVRDVFHVSMLRTYESNLTRMLNLEELDMDDRVLYVENPVQIMDWKDLILHTKTIPLVKVIWQHHGTEGATWKSENSMGQRYPYPFV